MDKTKCITFDKVAQDALPERIKEKMKADREKAVEERNKGMKVSCSRCHISQIYVPWVDKKKWSWGSMTMVVQCVIHRFGWKTIDTHFVCPKCQTEDEKDTDYSKSWYNKYYALWEENKEVHE